uniref:Uncharacterized protein n=1 Tax=Peronospora matthiolae TaxID=2874970 RepID=A0AAV1UCJ7_9STRA
MRTNPTFYVGRLKPYHQYAASSDEERPCAQASRREPCAPEGGHRQGSKSSYLSPRPINIPTRYPYLVTQRRQSSLVLKLSKGKLSSTLQDSVRHLETPFPLMFEIVA